MQLEPGLAGASIQADVIGVTKEKMATLDAIPVSKYWQSPGARQTFAAKSFRFGAGAASTQTLPANDPAWSQWGSPTDVVVLVDLPGVFDDLPGAADPRRKTISLDASKRGGSGPIKLQIQPGGVQVVSP